MNIEPAQTWTLSPHGDLKRRGGDRILVLPERAIRIGGSGAEILELLLEPHTSNELVAALRARYPGDDAVEDAAVEFLEEMIELGGVVRHAPVGGPGRSPGRGAGRK